MKAMKRMVMAAGLGAAVAHFWDPDRGRSRRVQMRDQASGKMRRVARRVERIKRRASSDLYGMKQRAEHAMDERPQVFLDDATLTDKVRSEVLGNRAVPKGHVSIDAHNGVVALRGQVRRPDQIREIERLVRRINGVYDVQNLLHTPATPAPNKITARRIAG